MNETAHLSDLVRDFCRTNGIPGFVAGLHRAGRQTVVTHGIANTATVVSYLPRFGLTTPGAAERIRVRHLIDHTSGIDADLFFPDAEGPHALETYVERLGRQCGALFPAGHFPDPATGEARPAGTLVSHARSHRRAGGNLGSLVAGMGSHWRADPAPR